MMYSDLQSFLWDLHPNLIYYDTIYSVVIAQTSFRDGSRVKDCNVVVDQISLIYGGDNDFIQCPRLRLFRF